MTFLPRRRRPPWTSAHAPRVAAVIDQCTARVAALLRNRWHPNSCTGNALCWSWFFGQAGVKGHVVIDGVFAGVGAMDWVGHDWVVAEGIIVDGAWRQFRVPRDRLDPSLYVGGSYVPFTELSFEVLHRLGGAPIVGPLRKRFGNMDTRAL